MVYLSIVSTTIVSPLSAVLMTISVRFFSWFSVVLSALVRLGLGFRLLLLTFSLVRVTVRSLYH